MSTAITPFEILNMRLTEPDSLRNRYTRAAIGGLPDDFGTELGYGGDQFVYLPTGSGLEVAKLIFSTLTDSADQAAESKASLRNRYSSLVESIGDYALITSFDVKELDSGAFIVSAKQPFIEAPSVMSTEGVSLEALALLDNPKIQVNDFAWKSKRHRSLHGEGVEIFGDGNLVVISGRLLLVDTLTQSEEACNALQEHGVTIGEAIDLSFEALLEAAELIKE